VHGEKQQRANCGEPLEEEVSLMVENRDLHREPRLCGLAERRKPAQREWERLAPLVKGARRSRSRPSLASLLAADAIEHDVEVALAVRELAACTVA